MRRMERLKRMNRSSRSTRRKVSKEDCPSANPSLMPYFHRRRNLSFEALNNATFGAFNHRTVRKVGTHGTKFDTQVAKWVKR